MDYNPMDSLSNSHHAKLAKPAKMGMRPFGVANLRHCFPEHLCRSEYGDEC